MVTILSTYYEAEYYTEYEDIIPTQFARILIFPLDQEDLDGEEVLKRHKAIK